MKKEMFLEGLKSNEYLKKNGLKELEPKDTKSIDGGWFGPFGFGFRVFFHGGQLTSNQPMMG